MTVRFYGALNDFLPHVRRGTRFVHHLRDRASAKDTIEALGVPHPEVDLILLNGQPAAFTASVTNDDDLAVYPPFAAIPLDGVTRVGLIPPDPPRFAADIHLRKLASWLRLAGLDAIVIDDDAELARAGGDDGRIVLTRDVALLKRGVVRCGYWIRHTDPEWQLVEVLRRFDVTQALAPFTRCMACNTPLVAADISAVGDRVAECTRGLFSEFRECPCCRRVYWQGSHYPRLRAALERAAARSGRAQSDADTRP